VDHILDIEHDLGRLLRAALGAGDRRFRDRRRIGEPVPDLAQQPVIEIPLSWPALMGSSARPSLTACTLPLGRKSSGM
jgi:hypothetical protein